MEQPRIGRLTARSRKFGRFVLGLVLLCAVPAWGATDPCLQLAERLVSLGFYDEAVTEYKRYLYFNPGDAEVEPTVYSMAIAYRELGQYAEAAEALRRAASLAPSDSIRDQRRIDEAVLLLALGQVDRARFQLSRVGSYTKEPLIEDRANALLAFGAVQEYQWEESRSALTLLAPRFESGSLDRVDSLLLAAVRSPRKSPAKARRLSTILPGSGQLYAGKPLEGVHSLSLNAFFGTLLTTSMIAGDYAIGIGLYFQLFYRYYAGGIYHAGLLAEERNRAKAADRRERISGELEKLISTSPAADGRQHSSHQR